MECYSCGAAVGRARFCPHCRTDLYTYRRFVGISNFLYNRGLKKAGKRDITGAIEDLKLALSYNKVNTDARNLLGLCYYQIGEESQAVAQWIISYGFQHDDNRAADYLEDTKKEPAENERINQNARKYNQALEYAKSGSYDMAKIQLKKALTSNPNHVKSYQLVALLELHDGNPDEAMVNLKKALSIDRGSAMTNRYIKAAQEMIYQRQQEKPKHTYRDFVNGTETVIQPKSRIKNTTLGIILNVAIGVLIGVAFTGFLVIPGIRKNAIADANETINATNETVAEKNQQIKILEDKVSELTGKTTEASTDINQLKSARDAESILAQAYYLYYADEIDATMDAINSIDGSLLTKESLPAYDELKSVIEVEYLAETFQKGLSSYDSGNTESAIVELDRVVNIDETYGDGTALYTLAQAYRKEENIPDAIKYYTRVIELFPDSNLANNAEIYIGQLATDQE